VLWDLNDVVFNVIYNHLTLTTTGATTLNGGGETANVSFLDRSTDQVASSLAFRTGTATISVVEVTAATTSFPDDAAAGYTSASAGAFYNTRLTQYTSVAVSAGYRVYSFESTVGTANEPGGVLLPVQTDVFRGNYGSIYADLYLAHRLNRYYNDSLTFSRSSAVGLYGDLSQTTSLNYNSSWAMGRQWTLNTTLLWQDVEEITGPLGAAPAPSYQILSFGLGTSYMFTKHLRLSAAYQYTIKLAGEPGEGYSQNRVRLGFGYQF
jgi:hypothetical protein